jgi:hypothetical protein
MKFAHLITLVAVAGFAGSAAATIPLDRPTPPPCCADGICHAHAKVFGVNKTRWRVWPGVSVAPMPTVKQPVIRNIPGITDIELPKPEEEDRQAPPPIRTLTPPPTTVEGPAAPAPGTTPPSTTPPSTLPFEPFGPESVNGPLTPQTMTPGGPLQSTPQTMSPTGQQPSTPRTAPFGAAPGADTDRPPTPPFRSASRAPAPQNVQPAAQPVGNWPVSRSNVTPASSERVYATRRAGNDPPPTPPFALGNSSL